MGDFAFEQRLAAFTAVRVQQAGMLDCVRFLSCGAIDGHSLAADSYLEKFGHSPTGEAVKRARLTSGRWALETKAASSAATTTTTGYAAELMPPTLLTALAQRLQLSAVIGRIPSLTKVPFRVPVGTQSQAPSVAWVPEGGAKPVSTMGFNRITLGPAKLAGILVLTEELARATRNGDVDAGEVMARALVDASTRAVDTNFLNPALAAVANLSPASITNGAPSVTASGNLANDLAALVSLFFSNRPDATAPCFVLSPAIAAKVIALGTHHDLKTNGGTLLGIPAVTTPGAGNTITLLEAPGVYVADTLARVDISKEAALQMNSTPDSPPTASTVVVDLWSTNRIGILVDRWCNWQRETTAVAYLTVA